MHEKFEQNRFSLTAEILYRIGNDSTRLMEWMAYYDKFYENITYFDSTASVLSTFEWNTLTLSIMRR